MLVRESGCRARAPSHRSAWPFHSSSHSDLCARVPMCGVCVGGCHGVYAISGVC